VGATDFHSQITDYSLPGSLDVVAPGGAPDNGQILSTNTGGGYGRGHGTSQAAAHAAGAVALLEQRASELKMPPLSFEEVRRILQTTATPLVDPSTGELYPKNRQGAGLINVYDMVQELLP
jgi:subtilisin family serine protease